MACRAQPSARRALGRRRRSGERVAWAQWAVSSTQAVSWFAAVASPDEAAEGVRQPEVLAVAEAPRQVAVAERDGAAAAARQPAAGRAAAGVQRQAAAVQDVVAAAEPQREVAPGAAGVLMREARGEALAARPSAAAWAAPLCLQAARLAPSARTRFARATEGRRIALP
jgi:hypothetical protein